MRRIPPSAAGSPLLAFEHVTKGYPDGRRRIVVLERVSFAVHAGDFVGILGPPRTGKSTLMRLAAGIEAPDDGTVSFQGRDLGRMSTLERGRLLRTRIGLLATDDWRPGRVERAVDLVALPLVSDGATLHEARRRARRMLDWAGAAEYADELARALSVGERTRAMLARALVREPHLLLVDEPAVTPTLGERDELYELLRSGARERGAALLVASQDRNALRGACVLMTIGDGELCSTGEPGVVLPFRDRRASGMERPRS
jgi:ABC-type cobalamin/Fe3+-siderophores transport system ATPase subunit